MRAPPLDSRERACEEIHSYRCDETVSRRRVAISMRSWQRRVFAVALQTRPPLGAPASSSSRAARACRRDAGAPREARSISSHALSWEWRSINGEIQFFATSTPRFSGRHDENLHTLGSAVPGRDIGWAEGHDVAPAGSPRCVRAHRGRLSPRLPLPFRSGVSATLSIRKSCLSSFKKPTLLSTDRDRVRSGLHARIPDMRAPRRRARNEARPTSTRRDTAPLRRRPGRRRWRCARHWGCRRVRGGACRRARPPASRSHRHRPRRYR